MGGVGGDAAKRRSEWVSRRATTTQRQRMLAEQHRCSSNSAPPERGCARLSVCTTFLGTSPTFLFLFCFLGRIFSCLFSAHGHSKTFSISSFPFPPPGPCTQLLMMGQRRQKEEGRGRRRREITRWGIILSSSVPNYKESSFVLTSHPSLP